MKKLTAGILTVMLGIVSANSADAAVASKSYVDQMAKSEATAAKTAAEKTASDALASAKSDLEGQIGAKVAQSDYNTKIAQLEQADTDISNLVGTLPAGVTATTIVGYVQEKTAGIATEGAMTELSGQVSALSDKVDTNTGAIETLNGDASTTGSVAKKIADSITALDLANSYDAKGAAAAAETAAKAYADGLASNYDAAGAASTAEQNAKKYTDEEIQALDSSIAAEANKVVTGVTVEDGKITATQKMALSAIATINPACSNPTNYCVLTSNGTDFVWEVIERATDGSETLTTGGDSGRTAATTVAQ